MDKTDLQYPIPPDVLHFEPRYWFGLSAQDLVVAAFPALLAMNTLGLAPGVLVGVLAVLLLRRLDSLGGRSVPVFLVQRLWYLRRPHEVEMPIVLPPERAAMVIEDWSGQGVARIQPEET